MSILELGARAPLALGTLLVAQAALSTIALAQSDEGAQSSTHPSRESAQAGMFLPFTEAPRTDTQRAFATAQGGYDFARKSAELEGRAEVTLYGPIALRIGTLYTQDPERLRPLGGLRVQALSQAREQGVDMSIGAFYKPEGFTEGEGEVEAVVALGHRIERVGLFANLAYGQDPEGAERDGEVRLAALYSALARMEIGFDSRLRFDLGSEEGKRRAEGEAEYDFAAGPALSYSLGQVALSAQAGVSVVGQTKTRVGPLLLGGVSGSF